MPNFWVFDYMFRVEFLLIPNIVNESDYVVEGVEMSKFSNDTITYA
jgi:hypothetical protein